MRKQITIAFTLVTIFVFTGCEKVTLTDTELDLVNTNLKNSVVATQFYNDMVSLWNDKLIDQINSAQEEYTNKTAVLSEIYSLYNLDNETDKLINYCESEYEENIGIVKKELAKDNASTINDIKELDTFLREFADNKTSKDSYESQHIETTNKYTEDVYATLFMLRYPIGKEEIRNIYYAISNRLDIRHVVYEALDISTVRYQEAATHIRCLFFALISDYIKKMKAINIDYIAKEPETINSFQIGFNNHTAYLCTFTTTDDSTRIVWQPIEYDQTLIGMGL